MTTKSLPRGPLAYRDYEAHTYSVPDAIVRQCPNGRVLLWYALAVSREKRAKGKAA